MAKAEATVKKNSTKIVTCTCQHEYQDKKYGAQRRVANHAKKGFYRCTVCKAQHPQ